MGYSQDDYLKDLELLVNMDSGQGNPNGITAVGEYFARRFQALGWIAELHYVGGETGLCTVVKNREAEHYDALLVGHVDTVFPTGETAKRPFRRDETRAYGLGVLDMKQGCLAMLYALAELPKEVFHELNIVAIFNPDEEINSIYSAPLIDEYAAKSDYAFVFEAASTDGSHTVERKGRTAYHLAFRGRAGHAGYLFDGSSLSAINELLTWADGYRSLQSRERGTGVNIGVIQGGVKDNIVPDYAEMRLEIRYETKEEQEKVLDMTRRLFAHAKESGVVVETVNQLTMPALTPTEKTLAYLGRVKTMAEGLGLPFYVKKRGGISDANHIAACGPVCLDGLGPTGDFDHSDKEYLELSTIEPSIQLACGILCDLAKMKKEKIDEV